MNPSNRTAFRLGNENAICRASRVWVVQIRATRDFDRTLAPDGVHHIVEVTFGANIKTDMEVLAQGGSIATYATNAPTPEIPVWQLVFVNARISFVGSDDVPAEAKTEATHDINQAREAGWRGLDIAEIVPLAQIARAHELVEHPVKPGRVIVLL
jgi:NADPH:quinone reductase